MSSALYDSLSLGNGFLAPSWSPWEWTLVWTTWSSWRDASPPSARMSRSPTTGPSITAAGWRARAQSPSLVTPVKLLTPREARCWLSLSRCKIGKCFMISQIRSDSLNLTIPCPLCIYQIDDLCGLSTTNIFWFSIMRRRHFHLQKVHVF